MCVKCVRQHIYIHQEIMDADQSLSRLIHSSFWDKVIIALSSFIMEWKIRAMWLMFIVLHKKTIDIMLSNSFQWHNRFSFKMEKCVKAAAVTQTNHNVNEAGVYSFLPQHLPLFISVLGITRNHSPKQQLWPSRANESLSVVPKASWTIIHPLPVSADERLRDYKLPRVFVSAWIKMK